MTTRKPGGRPSAAVKVATSSATAVRISAAMAPPSSNRALAAVTRSGSHRRGDGIPRLATACRLPRRLCEPLDLVEQGIDPRARDSLEVRVANGGQVDDDVGRGPSRCRLAE